MSLLVKKQGFIPGSDTALGVAAAACGSLFVMRRLATGTAGKQNGSEGECVVSSFASFPPVY